MKPRLLLFLLLSLLLPALCLAAPKKKKISPTDDRGLKAVSKVEGDSRQRVALVIGNSTYVSSPLKNPANDARVMAASLRRLGFDVVEKTNLSYAAMNEVVESFGNRLKSGGVALFYYAGHGMQVNGNNYLIPTDARINAESEVRYKAVDAGLVLSKMEQAKSDVNIVVLDACRDNPFSRSFRSSASGLASMEAPNGTFIAYATAPGKTAADGSGSNGLYTQELVRVLETPGLKLEDVFKRTSRGVKEQSGNKQSPWVASNLDGDFWFVPPSGADASPAAAQPQVAMAPRPQAPRPPVRSESFTDPTTGMEFVLVKGGCYQMGDTFGDGGQKDEKPVHEVCVNDFYMGKHEVTNGQYRKFVAGHSSGTYEGHSLNGDSQPVVQVSWFDATSYAQWLSRQSDKRFRLPTEAEWEYAARGGSSSRNYWGGGKDDACDYANVHDLTSKRTFSAFTWENHNCSDGQAVSAPVGSFRPNSFGLHDMMGNVWEWCSDWYGENWYGSSPKDNPQGPSSGDTRVLRGGSWSYGPGNVRAAYRFRVDPTLRSYGYGFRLVLSAQ